ncbi:hypothetical protein [Spirosoma rhododendri]|uniref:Uncharacterized protein n=1 Tax=Spirosoma rhododendri TaxID=2728024 RepID=A0A7L5DQL1_9BACT|nr:hypothetical protein [Spirosoma rhododendri]QJD79513.1 hypothetical protein HH216_14675 [Spirosoma rhododendri]
MRNLFALLTGRRPQAKRLMAYPTQAPYSIYGSQPHVLVTFHCHRSVLISLRRLIALRRTTEQLNPSVHKPREYTVESLLCIESLMPVDPHAVVMSTEKHQLLARFFRAELSALMHNKVSPFQDLPKSFLFDDLTAAIQLVESAITITPTCHQTQSN